MDLMKIIESLDEALYTVMSWIVFYPRTLWRTIAHPLQTMTYADREVSDRPEDQYDDAIRPPLFLFLSLLLSHGVETALTGENPLISNRHGLAALVDSDMALLALRLYLFSLFPLMMAVRLLHRQGKHLTHASLRRPFYGQCYAAAPFALLIGLGSLMTDIPVPRVGGAGIAIVVAISGWYIGVQTVWFSRKLGRSLLAGLFDTFVASTISIVLFLTVALIV